MRGGNFNRNRSNDTRGSGGDTSLGDAFRQRRNMRGNARGRSGGSSHAVMEQGSIRSLKDSFGFIYCANRAEELFFHFSQVSNTRATDLNINDEVEFRVGTARDSNENSKQAAYSVVRLRSGTVVWETEDEPGMRFQGIVEKPVRLGRDGTVQHEGVIRVLELTTGAEVTATGPPVKFTPADYVPEEKSEPEQSPMADENSPDLFRRSSAVGKAELLRRTSSSTALEKANQTRNRLGVQDLVEFTLVTAKRDKSQFARNIMLLQSHREHQRLLREERLLATATKEQGVVAFLKTDYGFLRSNKRREEVYFHYSNVDLGDINEDNDYELKAGQEMEFLVVTEDNGRVSAREVKFCDRGSVEFHKFIAEGVMGTVSKYPRPAGGGNSEDICGSVRLLSPLKDGDKEVKEIDFYSADSPGGSFSVRDGSFHLWVREGDTLLFDVVKESADESIRVYPTKKEVGAVGSDVSPSKPQSTKLVQADLDAMLITSRSVKLVSCNPAGRSEGTINVVKDQFGFLHCAERPVDSYFKLFESLPLVLQKDLRRGMGIYSEDKNLELTAGAEVQFDLSLQKSSQSKSSNGKQQEKEQLKAQRLLLLPPNTVVKTKVLAKGIKGVVQKEDPRQTYSGTIELDEEVQTMSLEERHPYVYKVVQSMLNDESIPSIVFPEAQSVKEDDVVMDLVETLGKGQLSCSHLPSPDSRGNARLIIRRGSGEEPEEGEGRSRKKKKILKPKEVKTIHYDKHCLLKEFQEGYPPCEGDTIVCDIIQVRRTRVVQLTNVKIVERDEKSNVEDTDETGVGLVTDFVPSRQFGFISVLTDENASKREVLFFQLKNSKIRKGDEVKFQIGLKKGGKRVAVQIEAVPKGSLGIPTKASKNACHGYVLMEPSHTSLADRDSGRGSALSPASSGNSRWENVDIDGNRDKRSNTNDEGLILLTQDPTKMFDGQTVLKYKSGAIAISGIGSDVPRRGDSISFSKGNRVLRDIRVVTKNSATLLRGNLSDIDTEKEVATFTSDEDDKKKYDIVLKDVVSCERKMLKKSEPVEGLVHDGKLYGICRTKDLFLESKIGTKGKDQIGSKGKERPKLNLTVRRGLGGKIQAQSMMAKGPDGTSGFQEGWTKRISQYANPQA